MLADLSTDLAIATNPAVTTAAAAPGTSWSDIGKQLALTFAKDVTGVVAPKVGSALGLSASATVDPAVLAAQQAAARTRTLWIVGGIGAAVVLGALVLRR